MHYVPSLNQESEISSHKTDPSRTWSKGDSVAIEKFEDIKAWQAGRDLTKAVYEMSSTGQFGRDYGLRDQIQRASVSVMANIAEGYDSLSNKEFVRFLGYALRSATEVQSHLYVALDQAYASQDQFNAIYQQAIEVKSLLHGFLCYLRNLRLTN